MIVLFNPKSSASSRPYLPLSLLALGAVIEGRYAYSIIDGNLDADPAQSIITALRAGEGKAMLGITVMPGPQLVQAVAVCREVKRVLPDVPIIWGGYFPTAHSAVCLRAEYVDYVVRGQGEETFLALLACLENGGNPADIRGLSFVDAGGTARHNHERPLISPQTLPALPYHRVPVETYVVPTSIGQRTLPHNASFGCPFLCNFCAVVTLVNGAWKGESGDRTATSVKHLYDSYAVDSVLFVDNNFFVSEKRMRAFAEAMISNGTAGKVRWWGEGRVDTLVKFRPETWELLRKAGCAMIFMGAESGSDETLARLNKGGTASTAATLEVARVLGTYGIIPEFSFMVGNPPNPDADIASTFSFIKTVKRVNTAAEIILYLYSPEPVAGEMFDTATAGGFHFPQTLEEWVGDEWRTFAHRQNPHTPWLRERHQRKVREFARVLNARYPTTTDARLGGWRGKVVKAAAGWRYQTGFYTCPVELQFLDKMVRYQRQDTQPC